MFSDPINEDVTAAKQENYRMRSEKKKSVGRLQKLKKRLSASFGRLALNKDDIIPELDHENDNVEVTKITMNGLSGEGIRSTYSYISLPIPPPSSLHTFDNVNVDYSEPNGNLAAATSFHSGVNAAIVEAEQDHMCLDDNKIINYKNKKDSKFYSRRSPSNHKGKKFASSEILNNFTSADNKKEMVCNISRSDASIMSVTPDNKKRMSEEQLSYRQQSNKPRPKSEMILLQSNNYQTATTTCNGNNYANARSHRYSSAFGGNSPFGRTEAYVKLEQLGEGSYATVYKGYSNLMNKVVALKEIRLQQEEGTPFTAIREASLLRGLKHSNIVTLHDIIHTKETLTFVFEYVHTDLSQYLERHPGGLNPKNVKLFLFQLLRGLAYCHERRVLHRDLKPQNLLISEIGELKLADFGLARAKSVPSRTYSHEVVTLWYRPPDVLLGSTDYSMSLDMWGVGCIFVEMITGVATFPGVKDTSDQLDKIWRILGTPTEETWEGVSRLPHYKLDKFRFYKSQRLGSVFQKLGNLSEAEDIAVHFLQVQPGQRISAAEALVHDYFCDLPVTIHNLPDHASVFSINGCKMTQETHNHPISVIKAAAKLRA
ncbi:CDK14 (predicted) [Pycnogonum litorale]